MIWRTARPHACQSPGGYALTSSQIQAHTALKLRILKWHTLLKQVAETRSLLQVS